MLLYEATELKKYTMCHGITFIPVEKYICIQISFVNNYRIGKIILIFLHSIVQLIYYLNSDSDIIIIINYVDIFVS